MRTRPSLVATAFVLWFSGGIGAPSFERVEALYRPFRAEQVTLSPDGRRVAYTEHAAGQLFVIIRDVDNPTVKVRIRADEDRTILFSKEKKRAQLRFLRWLAPDRLVIAPEEEVVEYLSAEGPTGSTRKVLAPIFGVDADGTKVQTLVDAHHFTVSVNTALPPAEPNFVTFWRQTRVVGRMPDEPEHFLVEAIGLPAPARHLAPIPNTLFKVNARTGKIAQLAEETMLGQMFYDWQGRARIAYLQPEHTSSRKFLHLPPRGRWIEMNAKWSAAVPTGFTLSPKNYFQERAFPLGFGFDPKVFYFASNVGRDTFGVYALDVETRQRLPHAIEHPHLDLASLEPAFPASSLVFDEKRRALAGVRAAGVTPLTVWSDSELVAVQRDVDGKFPRRTVEILEWDDARQRFLLRVTGGSEPGRYFVFQREENLLVEFLRRAPWLPAAELHDSTSFAFDTPAGVHLTGYLTLPRQPRIDPPPLLLYFPAGFPSRVQTEFDREAQLLADMGFIVLRLNHRGTTGFGARHRDAIHAGVDRLPVEDALAAIEWVTAQHPIDRRRIATMGEGFGGFLALRALQLHPERFRCAIALDAPLDLERWLKPALDDNDAEPLPIDTDLTTTNSLIPSFAAEKTNFLQEVHRAYFQRNATRLSDSSVLRDVASLTKPVFLIVDPLREPEIVAENDQLRAQLRRLGRAPDYLEVNEEYALQTPAARARVFRRIEEFFNLNLYDFKVQVGESEEVK